MDLKLKSIRLENFKRHADITVEFSDTLTVIRGDNYKGKSTLLRGVAFVMGGPTFAGGKDNIQRRITAEQIGRRSKDEKTRATLNFTVNGERRVASRTLSAATVWDIEGNILATGHTAVTDWFEQQLGMEIKRALLLAYSDEGEAAALLKLGAPALSRMMEQIADADYIERLIKRCASRVTAAKGVIESLGELADQAPIREDIENQKAAYHLAANSMRDDKAEAEKLLHEQQEKEAALDVLTKDNAAIRARARESTQLDGQIQVLQSTVSDIEKELVGKTEKKLATALSSAEKKDEKAKAKLSSLRDNVAKIIMLNEKLAPARLWFTTVGDVWKQNDKLYSVKFERKQAEFRQCEQEYRVALDLAARLKEQLDSVNEEIKKEVCVACKRPFNAEHLGAAKAKQAELQHDFDEQTTVSNTAMAARDAADAERAALEKQIPPVGWALAVEQRHDALAALEAELIAIDPVDGSVLAKVVSEAQETAQALKDAERAVTLFDSASERLRRAQDELGQKLVARKGIQIGIEIPTDGMQEGIDAIKTKIAKLKNDYIINRERSVNAEARVKELEKQLDQLIALYQRRTDNESIVSRYGGLSKWLKENKDAFLRELWDTVLAGTSEFAAICTNGDITQVLRSDDGEFSYIENGVEYSVDGSGSGAQKAAMGVGLRLALPDALPQGVSFSVLDEPSAAMTEEVSKNLGAALRTLNRQIIVITHREGEEFSADKVVVIE